MVAEKVPFAGKNKFLALRGSIALYLAAAGAGTADKEAA